MRLRALAFGLVLGSLTFGLSTAQSGSASATTPECDQWVFTAALDLEPGFWTPGQHTYGVRVVRVDGSVFERTHVFSVHEGATLYRGEIFLRIPGVVRERTISAFHPDQNTAFHVVYNNTPDDTRQDVLAQQAGTTIQFAIDGGSWITTTNGPVVKLCSWNNPGRFYRDYSPDVGD